MSICLFLSLPQLVVLQELFRFVSRQRSFLDIQIALLSKIGTGILRRTGFLANRGQKRRFALRIEEKPAACLGAQCGDSSALTSLANSPKSSA